MITGPVEAAVRSAAALLLVAAGLLLPSADAGGCWPTAFRCHELTVLRGGDALDQDRDLQRSAEAWAEHMAATGVLEHSGDEWENVGYGPDWRTVFAGFMASPRHRANMLDPDARRVGIGAQRAGDHVWVVLQFR